MTPEASGTVSGAVREDDEALLDWARGVCGRLSGTGIRVRLQPVSSLMLRSRMLSGYYQAVLTTRGFMDIELMKHADVLTLTAEEMTGTEVGADAQA